MRVSRVAIRRFIAPMYSSQVALAMVISQAARQAFLPYPYFSRSLRAASTSFAIFW